MLPSDSQQISKTRRRDKGRPRPFTFQERVRRNGGTVHDGHCSTVVACGLRDARDDDRSGICGFGAKLENVQRAVVVENGEIGEGSAGINADSQSRYCNRSAVGTGMY